MKKNWILSAVVSLVITAIVFVYFLFSNWGIPYFTKNVGFGMIFPFVLFFLFATVCCFVIIWGVNRSKELAASAKRGDAVDVTVVDGLPNMLGGTVVKVELGDADLVIGSRTGSQTARLGYSKIYHAEVFTDTQIIEKDKSIVGRAIVGGLLMGGVGAIVGGMTGFDKKQKSESHTYLIINYHGASGEELVLSFQSVGATWGLGKFCENLRQRAGIASIVAQAPQNDVVL